MLLAWIQFRNVGRPATLVGLLCVVYGSVLCSIAIASSPASLQSFSN